MISREEFIALSAASLEPEVARGATREQCAMVLRLALERVIDESPIIVRASTVAAALDCHRAALDRLFPVTTPTLEVSPC